MNESILKKCLLALILFSSLLVSAQITGTVNGTIKDTNGLGLPGVNVFEKGNKTGVISDMDGNYTITLKGNNPVLVFSFIGYLKQEMTVSGQKTINIILKEEPNKLEEVVVIGYGSTLRKDLTSSVSVVDLGDAQKVTSPRIETALAGRIAGVNITSPNSEPGAGLQIRIRGGNSINGDNSPLLVVDGVLGGDFESLNINDVENMQVLKDASATAIYGSLGANGVIIVTTKRGKLGKVKIDLYTSTGIQKVRKKMDLMNADQHREYLKRNPDFVYPTDIDNVKNLIESGKGTDWQDEVFQTGIFNNEHLNISQAGDKFKTFFSLDFTEQQGAVIESGYKKISGRLNNEFKVSDKFNIKNNISIYEANSTQIRASEDFGSFGSPVTMSALQFSPLIPVYSATGAFNGPLNSASVQDNPVNTAKNVDDLYGKFYFQDVLSASVDITKDLTYDFLASYTRTDDDNKRYTSKSLLRALNRGEARIANNKGEAWQLRNTITYNKQLNKNNKINVVAGYELSESNSFSSRITAAGFATEANKFNNIGLASSIIDFYSRSVSYGLASYLGRATYGYKEKYLFAASGRYDGSTKFATNNKWAFFPSGSAAWVISKEKFLADNKTINHLKLRGSYGESGSQAINPYQSLAQYRTGLTYSYGGSDLLNGVLIDQVANPNLKWETTAQYDFGIDAKFFNSRIELTYDYYSKTTTDLLFDKALMAYTGINSQIQNVGQLQNKGHEFGIEAVIADGKFKWDVSANISFVKNKVLDLGGADNIYISSVSSSRGSGFGTAGVLKVGEAIGNFFGYKANGIFLTQLELDASSQPGKTLGAVRFEDSNGDGLINANDRQIIGNALPDYTFGINNNFSYGNFDLNITVQGQQGNEAIWFDKGRILSVDILNAWSPSNPTTSVPRGGNLGNETNSNYVEDASFVKFRNILLGYNFPQDLVKKLGVSKMRLYLSAVDAFVITKYSGFDPEVNSKNGSGTFSQNVALGFDEGSYPGVAQYLLGFNISF